MTNKEFDKMTDNIIDMLNLEGKDISEIIADNEDMDNHRLYEIAKELQGENSVDGLPSDFVEITDEAVDEYKKRK